jgi:hypothetical protein
MANKRNFQRELDEILLKQGTTTQRLFLHSCCAPCSSYVLEYLSAFFEITVFYYNPNITYVEEYAKRVEEQKRLIQTFNEQKQGHEIHFVEGSYDPERFYEIAKGHEKDKEGGERCFLCYEMRLQEAATYAKEGGYDYFTTTLSISPMKNAEKLNEIGEKLAEVYKVAYLTSDFKKKNGYKRSIELSKEYNLYRQDYCGCVYSKAERDRQRSKATAL